MELDRHIECLVLFFFLLVRYSRDCNTLIVVVVLVVANNILICVFV